MTDPENPIALTMGDPGGIGAEITIKAWQALNSAGHSFFIIDDPNRYYKMGISIMPISDPTQCRSVFPTGLPVLPLTKNVVSKSGAALPKNAPAIIESIERAVQLVLENRAAAVVTNPINKLSLQSSGFEFPGHTEFLAALTAPSTTKPTDGAPSAVMMLAGPYLRTVPVTVHMSVRDAISTLTPDLIYNCARITADSLQTDFGVEKPRIAISGLNPHAGEGGVMGAEDDMIIAAAIDKLSGQGYNVIGPLSADTMFHEEARKNYDAAICMLHDQALIPVKTLSFHDAVNVTLGLPIVRTSPDHGTALDIAGKGLARADSLIAAIKLAGEISERRRSTA